MSATPSASNDARTLEGLNLNLRKIIALAVIDSCFKKVGNCQRKVFCTQYSEVLNVSHAFAYKMADTLEQGFGLIDVDRAVNGYISTKYQRGWALNKLLKEKSSFGLAIQALEKEYFERTSGEAQIDEVPLPVFEVESSELSRLERLERTISKLQSKLQSLEGDQPKTAPTEPASPPILVAKKWGCVTNDGIELCCNWEFDVAAKQLISLKFMPDRVMDLEELTEANKDLTELICDFALSGDVTNCKTIQIVDRDQYRK